MLLFLLLFVSMAAVAWLGLWIGVLAGERHLLRVSWPKSFALPPVKLAPPEPPSVRVRRRFATVSRDLQRIRNAGQADSPIGKIFTSWFDCLAWVVDFERLPRETIDDHIARVLVEFPGSEAPEGRYTGQA